MAIELTRREARRLFLASQGMLKKNAFGRGKPAVKRAIDQLSYVQIDTISVIERAHNHILWTRIDNYDPAMLDSLQRHERYIFEYWFHAAAYLPISDYRYYLPAMESFAASRQVDTRVASKVLARIRQEGPLKARDFDDPLHKSSGWWNWKPAKLAMEHLYRSGELMVSHREGFQKVYDLRERILPGNVSTLMPTRPEWLRFQIMLMTSNMGLATEREIIYQRHQMFGKNILPGIKATLANLVEDGELLEVTVDNIRYFTTSANLEKLPQRIGKRRIRFLSPFDNLIIQRQRTRLLFDFDYQLECYVPAAKRVYGYFVLPILWGDELVGRMDAKADRKTGMFHVFSLFMEVKFHPRKTLGDVTELSHSLCEELKRFARFHRCDRFRIHASVPDEFDAISRLDGCATG